MMKYHCDNCDKNEHDGTCLQVAGANYGHCTEIAADYWCENYAKDESYWRGYDDGWTAAIDFIAEG
jgi:hypothetical protein